MISSGILGCSSGVTSEFWDANQPLLFVKATPCCHGYHHNNCQRVLKVRSKIFPAAHSQKPDSTENTMNKIKKEEMKQCRWWSSCWVSSSITVWHKQREPTSALRYAPPHHTEPQNKHIVINLPVFLPTISSSFASFSPHLSHLQWSLIDHTTCV